MDGAPSPPFFEITNSVGLTEGWMLGTIHALPDGTDWRTPAIDAAIEDADRAVVEVVNLRDAAGVAETFARLSATPGMGPLEQRVDPSIAGPLMEMAELSGIPPARFNDTETWGAAIMLARVGAVGEPRNGVDRYILSRFEGRPTYGFELAREQLGIFDALAEEDQRALLEGTVEEWEASKEDRGHLTRAWLSGDDAALEAATTTGIMADPELRAALLVDRNTKWLRNVLVHLGDRERPLFAVGAAHLIGPDGLPAMLEERGYTVTRVR